MIRRVLLVAALGSAALAASYLVQWSNVSSLRQRGSDFSVTWVAGDLLRQGEGAHLYDQAAEARAHAAILPPGTTFDLPFITPPPTALVGAAFTPLDPETAYRLWCVLQFLALLGGCFLAARAAPWPRRDPLVQAAIVVIAACTAALLPLLLVGQWDGEMALGLGGAYALWRRDRPGWAGFVLALSWAVVKPHLGIGLGVWMLARRDWRAVEGAGAAIAGLAAASVGVAGLSGSGDFIAALRHALGNTPPLTTLGMTGLSASWLGSGTAADAVAAAGSIAALLGCFVIGRRRLDLEPSLIAAAALSLLAAPHLLSHDLVLAAPLLVAAAAWAMQRDAAAGRRRLSTSLSARVAFAWILLDICISADTGNGAPAPPGRLVPLMLLGIGATALAVRAQSGRGSTAGVSPV